MNIKKILELDEHLIKNTKLHLAIGIKNKYEPLQLFVQNKFKKWQELQSKKNFERKYILSYPYLENCIKDFELLEILRDKYSVESFPGFDKVKLSFEQLKSIFKIQDKSWKTVLSSVKGVYVISDKTNGKFYIGSTYGEDTFWKRWADYVNNGHGNNYELKKLIEDNGIEYAKNFKFSILEIHNKNIDDNIILEREKFWKDVLLTREFGYNIN